ncbi:MAG: hypothetical protein J5879_07815 [Clostridia bacterium]|nr:hypothetical protein [Clostridia bacterium]
MIRQLLSQLAVLSVIGTSLLLICPGEQIKKYFRFAVSLCVLSVIVSALPLGADVTFPDGAAASVSDLSDQARELVVTQTLKRIEDAVTQLAAEKYGVDGKDIKVSAEYGGETDNVKILGVRIELEGLRYSLVTAKLKNSVSEMLDCPCRVVINE